MSKAILVMDMPSSCSDCKLKSMVCGVSKATHCCNLANSVITLDKGFEERLPDCPLKPMPQKIGTEEALKMPRNGCLADVINSYNACINEILGGSEE